MAAPRKIKQIEGIQKKLNQLYKNINFDELNYGEVKIDENSNFILDKEDEVNELIDQLNQFKNDILRYKEDYQSQQTTEKILNLLKSDSENAQVIKQLINEDDKNKSETNDNENKENSPDNFKEEQEQNQHSNTNQQH
ncbi:hypothetical protein BU064_12955 [Staphylococcus succinus]|nr:hypothetical protein BU064_12955 [Staphylococcus succinus]